MKILSLRLPVAVLMLLMCLPGRSQQTSASQESLLIGPGDMLHIQVFDAPELEQHTRVTDAGDVSLLMGGTVKVTALTPPAAAQAISNALLQGHFLLHPRVVVTIDQYATQNVSVIGEVHGPGAFPITTGRTVSEVIALAGGLTNSADRNIIVERHGSGQQLHYFLKNVPGPDSSPVLVYPGDTVTVAKAPLIYVLGDVGRPGGFGMTNNDSKLTVLEAVALAGGTNKTAVPSRARLIRATPGGGFQEIKLPLSAMQKGKQPDQPLVANDILYVPFSYLKNAALGVTTIAASAAGAAIYVY